jgi:hypothetical protein
MRMGKRPAPAGWVRAAEKIINSAEVVLDRVKVVFRRRRTGQKRSPWGPRGCASRQRHTSRWRRPSHWRIQGWVCAIVARLARAASRRARSCPTAQATTSRKRCRPSGPHQNFVNTRPPHPGGQKCVGFVPAPKTLDWIGQIDSGPRSVSHVKASMTGSAALRSAARTQRGRDGVSHRAACSATTVDVRRGNRRVRLAAERRIRSVPDAAASNGGPRKNN